LLTALENQQDWLLQVFKSGRHCTPGFSKKNFSSETYLADLKTGDIGPGRFSKSLGALSEICYFIGAKNLK
jgi:hypothetical protein